MRDDKSPFCRDGVLWDVFGDFLYGNLSPAFLGFYRERKNWRVHWMEPDVATEPVGHEQSSHVSSCYLGHFFDGQGRA